MQRIQCSMLRGHELSSTTAARLAWLSTYRVRQSSHGRWTSARIRVVDDGCECVADGAFCQDRSCQDYGGWAGECVAERSGLLLVRPGATLSRAVSSAPARLHACTAARLHAWPVEHRRPLDLAAGRCLITCANGCWRPSLTCRHTMHVRVGALHDAVNTDAVGCTVNVERHVWRPLG